MMNRREAMGALSAFAMLCSFAEAQDTATVAADELKVFKAGEMKITRNPSGAAGWGVPAPLLPQGELLEVHVTTLDPGKDFAPMRLNPNASFRLIQTGKMEVLPQGQPSLMAETGDIVYAPAGHTYQVRNSSDTPLTYFVLQIKTKPAGA